MATNDNPEPAENGKWQVLEPEPTHPRRMRLPLSTASDVRRELARVYRGMKAGQIDPATGTKLGYLLNLLRQSIETSDIEARIQALEQAKEKQT